MPKAIGKTVFRTKTKLSESFLEEMPSLAQEASHTTNCDRHEETGHE